MPNNSSNSYNFASLQMPLMRKSFPRLLMDDVICSEVDIHLDDEIKTSVEYKKKVMQSFKKSIEIRRQLMHIYDDINIRSEQLKSSNVK